MNDKEKYNVALERAKVAYKDEDRHLKASLERIFPELKESENERIRKELIAHFRNTRCVTEEGAEKIAQWVAWLENQGKQTPIDYNEELKKCRENPLYFFDKYMSVKLKNQKPALGKEDERIMKAILTGLIDCRDAPDLGWSDFGGVNIDECIAWFKKQGEQTHAELGQTEVTKTSDQALSDKIEPKFKPGDYIVPNGITVFEIWRVINIDKDNYYNIQCTTNPEYDEIYRIPGFILEKDYRLWTLADAKNGDVLATCAGAFIYNGNNGGGSCPGSYCGINTLGKFQIGTESHWTSKKVYPATIEQCEHLFQKMVESGYKWDDENKSLI